VSALAPTLVEKTASGLRELMLRTARTPLKLLWAALYTAIARLVAMIVAPRNGRTSVYLTGSLVSGEPVFGLSDIDLVAVAPDEHESRRARRRFERLCRGLPPLRELIPDFCVYDSAGFARVLRGSYLVNGLRDGRAIFLGPEAVRDEKGLLERPGLYGGREWRRLRGRSRVPPPADLQDPPFASAWLELQYRWQWAFRACRTEAGAHRLAHTLLVEAARIWLWLAYGERHEGTRAPLKRALDLMDEGHEGLIYALEADQAGSRSSAIGVEKLRAAFVVLSDATAGLVNEAAFGAGAIDVELRGGDAGERPPHEIALVDLRALALPKLDWSIEELPRVVEQRLVLIDGDATDPAPLRAVAALGGEGRVTALRHGELLIEPATDVLGRGRLRAVQCRASDPISVALLDGRTRATFPAAPGWSPSDWARRAVAEHRAWLFAGQRETPSPHGWIPTWPAATWSLPATLGLLLSAARSALFLESAERGEPEIAVTFADTVTALLARDPASGADAAEALAVLEESRHEPVRPPPEVVESLRRLVCSLPAYRSAEMRRAGEITASRSPATTTEPISNPQPVDGGQFPIRRGTNVSHWLSQTAAMTEEDCLRRFGPDEAERIRELGLDHIRLPVDEHRLWHANGRRDERGFDSLSRTIEWCRGVDLAVIVSFHALRSRRNLRPRPPLFEGPDGADVLADLWTELSDTLRNLPLDAVAYELLGEPKAPDDEQWNQVAAACIAAIREREPDRTLVLGSNRQNSCEAFDSLAIPEDPALILSFHYYEPTLLTHYRASWIPHRTAYQGPIRYPGVPIPATALAGLEPRAREALGAINRHYDRGQICADMALPVSVARRSNHQLHCGEFGVYETVPDPLRLRWYRDVIDALEEHGIAWTTWDLKGGFGLYKGDVPTIAHQAIAERRFANG
jgi:endoglucanase